jgi:hypothetical protein
LEYWKPPPKVVNHIRAKSSSLFTPAGRQHRHSFANSLELRDGDLDKKNMSFAKTKGIKEDVQMRGGAGYQFDQDDSWYHPWYNFKYWGKRAWAGFVAVVVLIIVIIIIVAVEVTKNNAYPDYTQLSYSLADTCKSSFAIRLIKS